MKCIFLFAILSNDYSKPSYTALTADITLTRYESVHGVQLMILGTAEGAITIIAASVPILRPLFRSSRIIEPAKFLYNEDEWEKSLPSSSAGGSTSSIVKTTITSQPRISVEIDRKSLMPRATMRAWTKTTTPRPSMEKNAAAKEVAIGERGQRKSLPPIPGVIRQTEEVDVRVELAADEAMRSRRNVEQDWGPGQAI
jgi:hypothetical protein